MIPPNAALEFEVPPPTTGVRKITVCRTQVELIDFHELDSAVTPRAACVRAGPAGCAAQSRTLWVQ